MSEMLPKGSPLVDEGIESTPAKLEKTFKILSLSDQIM